MEQKAPKRQRTLSENSMEVDASGTEVKEAIGTAGMEATGAAGNEAAGTSENEATGTIDEHEDLVKQFFDHMNAGIYTKKTPEQLLKEADELDAWCEANRMPFEERDRLPDEEKFWFEKETFTGKEWPWTGFNKGLPNPNRKDAVPEPAGEVGHILTRKPGQVEAKEYLAFYKSLTGDKEDPLAYSHVVVEGDVAFKALLFVPTVKLVESFNADGSRKSNIRLSGQGELMKENFKELMPNYLAFVCGVVDSENLEFVFAQSKQMKMIGKKLTRLALDMIKDLKGRNVENFWKEYSGNVKVGLLEDAGNRAALSKIIRITTSASPSGTTSLMDYRDRMEDEQEAIYYMVGELNRESRGFLDNWAILERFLKKGFEVILLNDAEDENWVACLEEFEKMKFQNIAKEG